MSHQEREYPTPTPGRKSEQLESQENLRFALEDYALRHFSAHVLYRPLFSFQSYISPLGEADTDALEIAIEQTAPPSIGVYSMIHSLSHIVQGDMVQFDRIIEHYPNSNSRTFFPQGADYDNAHLDALSLTEALVLDSSNDLTWKQYTQQIHFKRGATWANRAVEHISTLHQLLRNQPLEYRSAVLQHIREEYNSLYKS